VSHGEQVSPLTLRPLIEVIEVIEVIEGTGDRPPSEGGVPPHATMYPLTS
jgi:hypothetical protein